jgi:hypothetical protein
MVKYLNLSNIISYLEENVKLIFLFSVEWDYKYSSKHDIIRRINYMPVKQNSDASKYKINLKSLITCL